jgi:indole-3-acetaldehyde oxidase
VFVDDIPAPKDCLYGAFIYSTRPHARVKGINFKSSLASQKVITVITTKDIPSGGENVGSSFPMLGDEALFADPVAEFAGQNIGVVVMLLTSLGVLSYYSRPIIVFMYTWNSKKLSKLTMLCCFHITQIAETQRYAYMAAKQAVIEYSTENLQPPILTIEDAMQQNSYFQIPPFLAPKPAGDFKQGMSKADHKILSAEVHTLICVYILVFLITSSYRQRNNQCSCRR